MLYVPHRVTARKHELCARLIYLGKLGFRRRRLWLRPFEVRVYRIERRSADVSSAKTSMKSAIIDRFRPEPTGYPAATGRL